MIDSKIIFFIRWKGTTEQVKKTLNKTDIEKAIAAGLKAAED
ncbi:MAG: hypothetical protein SWJ54_03740 [Cyanobacteriota bacterium]|nr:hypothetical protein [Cyanobacteriota bacterium]